MWLDGGGRWVEVEGWGGGSWLCGGWGWGGVRDVLLFYKKAVEEIFDITFI